tara:strand:- start:7013 stop:7675 length:663 start_codon:yes stop_codon:yes gene_type:complete
MDQNEEKIRAQLDRAKGGHRMNKFGTLPTNNNPPFGNNPATADESCYHLFWIDIKWPANSNTIGNNGLSNLPDHFGSTGGSMAKMCLCWTKDDAAHLKNSMLTEGYSTDRVREDSQGGASVKGFFMQPSERPCACIDMTNDPPDPTLGLWSECDGRSPSHFDILGRDGMPLDITSTQPFWVTSTGETVFLASSTRKGILQEILDWELSHPLKCCKYRGYY